VAGTTSIAASAAELTTSRNVVQVSSVPWYVWSALIAVTSTTFGLYWDISWHMTIGRDSFWTPAHLAIQFGAVLTGICCAYLILHTTFLADACARDSCVRIWGFRGPLGAFISAWGGFVMLTSAPFDNWWHDSFGLDVKILSPPHVVLVVGIFTMGLGGLILIAGRMNLADPHAKASFRRLLLWAGSLLLSLLLMLGYEYLDTTQMHTAIFYRVVGMIGPLVLIGIARASGHRWAATIVAASYTVLWAAAVWVFPWFPAEAKLGPVFTPETHMVPLNFPLLLLVPAVMLDLVFDHFIDHPKWMQASLAGISFLVALLAVQWPFAYFLVSPLARNRIFGMNYFPYMMRPSEYHLAWEFVVYEKTRLAFWMGIGIAFIASMVSARLGIVWGDWMRRVRR
jgi:hypothetical protein